MTGGEAIVGKVVSSASEVVSMQAEEVRRKSQDLRTAAMDSPEFGAAARTHAKRLYVWEAIKTKMALLIGRPFGITDEVFAEDVAAFRAKTSDIPEEHIVPPPPSLAFPAIEGLLLSSEEPDLRDMYLNLLATAADGRRGGQAHPAFAQIIKELSPEEAPLLLDVLRTEIAPIVTVRLNIRGDIGGKDLAKHLTPLDERNLSFWIDNWIRLRLINVDYGSFLTSKTAYLWASTHSYVALMRDRLSDDRNKVELAKGIMTPTDFGRRFVAAVTVGSRD